MSGFRKNIYILGLVAVCTAPFLAFGQEPVELLAKDIPGITQGQGLSEYLRGMFQIGLGLAVVLAVLQIVIGGFKYMTTDAASGKSEGKDLIQSAIFGLILALASVLILQTINPDIIDLEINFGDSQENTGSDSASGGLDSNGDTSTRERSTRNTLAAAGISVNSPPCTGSQTNNCTNVGGFSQATIASLVALKNDCNCDLTITGGTEGGHQTHAPGEPFVDLRKTPSLTNYITNNSSCAESTGAGNLYKVGSNNYVDEGSHWHGCMGSNCRITGHVGTC